MMQNAEHNVRAMLPCVWPWDVSYTVSRIPPVENRFFRLFFFFTGFFWSFLFYFIIIIFFSAHFYFTASGQAVVTGVIPSPPRFLPSIFIAHRVQQSHCSSIVHRMLLTRALALSASQFVHKKKSKRIYTSMHSAGLELTKLTYTRLQDNLICHRGDRFIVSRVEFVVLCSS